MAEPKPFEFSITSSIGEIDAAVARIAEFAAQAAFDESALFAIDMATREAIANAVKHGNLLDPSKHVEIGLGMEEGNLRILIRDHGSGFKSEEIPDPTNPENLLKASGRGVLFMRNFMDEVTWTAHPEGGTVVSMLKTR